MKKLYTGKTKDVYLLDDGNVLLKFKNAITGTGTQIDSGANEVIGEVPGKGRASLSITAHFFGLLHKAGLTTHFIGACPEEGSMVVRRARTYGLEVVCRLRAWGSFVRRYGRYVVEGTPLSQLIEFTIKDDDRGDPLINDESLVALGIVTSEQIDHMKDVARKATEVLRSHLATKGLELVDIKYEFGEIDGRIVIIDEISGDSMRVTKEGKVLLQKDLAQAVLDRSR